MNVISIKNLNKSYGLVRAIDNLTLEIGAGRIVGLVGPNGSGKTSLLRILGSVDQAFTGEALVAGQPVGTPEAKAVVSYLADKESFSNWKNCDQVIKDYSEFFADFDEVKARELLQFFKLEPGQKLQEMSKGMQEKLQILCAVSRQAKVYLLDEPISGVDPATRKVILQSIIRNYAEDALLIIATHLLQDIEPVLDEVVFLNQGQIYLYQPVDQLRAEQNKSINTIFEEAFR